jgi:O-6-methylguanine DNA methyltransferase
VKSPETISLAVSTPDGDFIASYSAAGLAALAFPSDRKLKLVEGVPAKVRGWHRLATNAVQAVLAGRAPDKLPPLDLSSGTTFQQSVWAALREIRCGETRSYAEVAKAVGKPGAARAVGGACGANPIPVLVPCHRVLAANHKLGGFSGGLHWKRLLLGRELPP